MTGDQVLAADAEGSYLRKSPRVAAALRLLLFAALLLVSASIREGPSSVIDHAIIWFPTGTAIAGLWLLGSGAWWVVAVMTFIQRMLFGYDWGVGLSAAAGSTLEALVGYFLLQRLGFRNSFSRLRDMGAVVVAAALAPLGSILMSWIGRQYIWQDPALPFYSGWGGWWRMNALGAIVVVPTALSWLGLQRSRSRLLVKLGTGLLLTSAVLATPFVLLPGGAMGIMWLNLALMGIALFAAVRYGVPGATLTTLYLALAVTMLTVWGFGPFPGLPHSERHQVIQLFELALAVIPTAFATLTAERRMAEERSRRSEDLLESINRNVNEGLFRADAAMRLSYANMALARMLGYDRPEQAIGSILSDALVDPARRDGLLDLIRTQGQWLNEEVQVQRRDGTRFWSLLTASAGRDAHGESVHYDGAIADITVRKTIEEQFRQSQKMEAVGKLAGGVAHDFNNILTVIIGYAECLRSEDIPPESRQCAEDILEAADRAAKLTQQLLAYGRRQMLSPRVIELNSVVDRMSDMLRRIIGEDIRFIVEHRSGSCWVRIDPSQLEQVLLNLVVNARDAMKGGGTVTVSTELEEINESMLRNRSGQIAGPSVTLRVRDTGEGMPPEVAEQAFDPFFTTKEMGRGTGLGLATVYGIVKQSGGAVWLDSAPGCGTTVTIQLRCETAPEESLVEPEPGTQGYGTGAGTILVTEDEPAVRRLVCATLASRGYRMLEAGDGVQALEALKRHGDAISLLITDVVMPVMGGRELVRRIRSSRPDLRVLFMSGYPNDERSDAGPASDNCQFLSKPFTSAQLLERVTALTTGAVSPDSNI